MTQGAYRNHQHYIAEGWSSEPKESFKALAALVAAAELPSGARWLDIGCATGELIGCLSGVFADFQFTGVDVTEDLLGVARKLLPEAEFVKASATVLPATMRGQFDVVTAIGCMSIFDDNEIGAFWDNLIGAAKPGGLVIVLSPLNEFGIDAIIRHRKRIAGVAGAWEAGWNVYSLETIKSLLTDRGCDVRFERFEIPFDLPRKPDPIRTWTMKTESRDRQLTNGLKLLVDHYFCVVTIK